MILAPLAPLARLAVLLPLALAAAAACAQPVVRRIAAHPAAQAPAAAGAPATLYSTISSPVDMYLPDSGLAVSGGHSAASQQAIALSFTPAADATLTRLVLPLALAAGDRLGLAVSVRADAGGLPGAELASWTGLTPFDLKTREGEFQRCCSYVQVAATDAGVPLKAGATYWIAATGADDSDVAAVWQTSTSGKTGRPAVRGSDGTWTLMDATVLPALGVYGPLP